MGWDSRAPFAERVGALPRLGLGVYQIPSGGACRRAIDYALSIGYRHIDTASFYGNEADVGRALRESGLRREEVFVTTKLWNSDQGYDSAIAAGERSLKRLGLDRIDLYLIHWPEPRSREDSWRALIELRNRGLVRSIGVSNYTVAHLEALLAMGAHDDGGPDHALHAPNGLKPASMYLEEASVTGTETALLAAASIIEYSPEIW